MNRKGFAPVLAIVIAAAVVAGVGILLGHKQCTLAGAPPPSPPGQQKNDHFVERSGQYFFCQTYWEKFRNSRPTDTRSDAEPVSAPTSPGAATSTPTARQAIGSGLPDLVVESVSFRPYQPPPPPPGSPQGVTIMGGNTLEFTVKVKNIGSGSFNREFYLENTRSTYDAGIGHYSHGELVNQNRAVLGPSETMEVKIVDSLDESLNKVRFLIATDGKPHLKIAYPRIDEEDYANNSYEVQVK